VDFFGTPDDRAMKKYSFAYLIRVAAISLSLTTVLAASGCPDGDGGGGGGGNVTYAEAVASCNAYCDALFAACTATFYPTVEVCKTNECSGSTSASAACYAAAKTYWDCRKVQPTICTELGCDSQRDPAIAACM
jgi:hypothetical protein